MRRQIRLLYSSRDFYQRICIKTFFATTRPWNGKEFEEKRGNAMSHITGTADFIFSKKTTRPDMLEHQSNKNAARWSRAMTEKKDGVQTITQDNSMAKFLDEVSSAIEESESHEVAVWVHGYLNSFNDAIEGGATWESYLKFPVIAYAWPANKTKIPSKSGYQVAVGNAEWNQEAFTSFIRVLNTRFPGKVTILCHSMGSRLVTGATHDLFLNGSSTGLFPEIVFASPDFDSATFANRFAKGLSCANQTRIYVNKRDLALTVSEDMWGNHSRVGRPGDDIGLLTIIPQTQVIDFEDYGGGLLGHNVPVPIISNIHKFKLPGKGWSLQAQPLKIFKTSN